jgi:hypothetical protein
MTTGRINQIFDVLETEIEAFSPQLGTVSSVAIAGPPVRTRATTTKRRDHITGLASWADALRTGCCCFLLLAPDKVSLLKAIVVERGPWQRDSAPPGGETVISLSIPELKMRRSPSH